MVIHWGQARASSATISWTDIQRIGEKPERSCLINEDYLKEITTRKTVLTVLGALLIVGSTVQLAAAAERYTHKSDRARVHATEQFRKANDSMISPSVEQQDLSDYSEGHVISAPAGR